MTNEVPYLGFQGQGTWSGSSWCSVGWGEPCTHCTRGVQSRQRRRLSVVVGPDNGRPNGVITTGGRPQRPHSLHSPHPHSLIISHPFHPGGAQDRCGTTYLPTRSHSSTPHGPPSLVTLPQFFLFFPSRMSAHFDTAEVLAVEADPWETTLTLLLSTCTSPWCPPAPNFDALLVDRGDQMVFSNFNAHHPSWYSRTGDDRAAAEGKRLMVRSTVSSSLLRTKTSLLTSPPRASPSRQISPFWAGISFLMWHGPPFPALDLTTSP